AQIVAPEHLELARDMVSRKVASGGPTVYELDVITNDGRRVPLEVSTRLMLREGKPIAVQGIARDIRERRRIETERAELLTREQAARAEAELANRAKDEFLATLSHELRTPLSAILIWARLLRSGRLDAEAWARALEVIERNTKLQARLIEDLLEVSRIIAGKLRLEWTPVELASTVDGAIDAVRAAADAKDITLELELERGLGLGLAIVRHLVDLHGGTVAARSAGEGRGATFTVRLPLSPTGVEAGDVAWLSDLGRRAAPGLSLGGIHILVVEDEPDTRESVALSLELCGGRVTAVASAVAALEVLDRDLPDVMLCDIGMPGIDGYALIREVRARGADDGGRIPAVALTAYARDEDRSRALEAGFQTHVPKPVEPTELAAVVANLCRASEPVERLAAMTRR